MIVTLPQPKLGSKVIGTASIIPSALQHGSNIPGLPRTGDQSGLGIRRRGRCFDQLDNSIDIGQGDGQTLQDMTPLPRFAQQVNGAPGDHFPTVPDKGLNHFQQVQGAGLTVYQGHHIDTHHRLQLGLGVQVVQHDITHLAPAQFYDHP